MIKFVKTIIVGLFQVYNNTLNKNNIKNFIIKKKKKKKKKNFKKKKKKKKKKEKYIKSIYILCNFK